MRMTFWLLELAGLAFLSAVQAQPRGSEQPLPPLVECGTHDQLEILCGTRSPEDLEMTPDGKFLIVSQFVNAARGGGAGAGLVLFDPTNQTFTKIAVTSEPLKDWGERACPGPIGDRLVPHGISLLKRKNGKVQLYVVNHGGRESIEMFELTEGAATAALVWHGCVVSKQAYNDVAALPNGGFFATHPTALLAAGADLFSLKQSGYVSEWAPGKSEIEVEGTRAGYPNGVVAAADGRYIYFNAWTDMEVHKYDLKKRQDVEVVKLDFMPDNLTWTQKGNLLAAGVKGARGDCPSGSGTPCIQAFAVAEIDPHSMKGKEIFDSKGKGALISGVSVALQMGDAVYVGAFQGERLLKFPWKE